MSAHRRRAAGFTLLEMVVALSITSVVALLWYSGSVTARGHAGRVDDDLASTRQALAVRHQIMAWLANAHTGASTPVGVFSAGTRGGRDSDAALTFLTFRRGEYLERVRVTLEIDRDPLTPEQGLVARIAPIVETPAGPEPGEESAVQLHGAASGLRLRFATGEGAELRWVSGWRSVVTPPRLVEVVILGEELPETLRVPIIAEVLNGS